VKSLQADAQHRPIDLFEEAARDVHDSVRRDPEQVAVIREVVDCAEGDPVDHGCGATRVAVLDDVRGLQQRSLAECADCAAGAVGAENSLAEAMLVQTDVRLASRVPAGELVRGKARRRRVGERQRGLERDDLLGGVVACDDTGATGVYWPGAMPRK
jgi:hypothetical protein